MEEDEWEVPKSEAPVYCMSSKVSNFDQSVGKSSRTNRTMDEAAIGRNDNTQVHWFAGWAMTQLESFRRFHVISGARPNDGNEPQRKEWVSKWNHVSLLDLWIENDYPKRTSPDCLCVSTYRSISCTRTMPSECTKSASGKHQRRRNED